MTTYMRGGVLIEGGSPPFPEVSRSAGQGIWERAGHYTLVKSLIQGKREIGVGVQYDAMGDTSGLNPYFSSASIYPQELVEEGEPQGIMMDRCPDQDRLPVV